MIEKEQILKCSVCGNTVAVVAVGGGEIVCCGKTMDTLEEITEGDKALKHLPVIKKEGDEFTVSVGEAEHPMDEEHFIQFIVLSIGDKRFIQYLKPDDKPELVVKTDTRGSITAKTLCNLHGLWINNL